VEVHQNTRKQCLPENTKQPSPVTPYIDFWWFSCRTNYDSNAIEANKLMS